MDEKIPAVDQLPSDETVEVIHAGEVTPPISFTPKEMVLTVPTHLLDGVSGYQKDLLGPILHEVLNPKNQKFVERDNAEQDPSMLQLIPYLIIRRGNEIFTYQRSPKSGESRLHGQYSLGVGGHINPIDGTGSPSYDAAFARELKEEVGLTFTGRRQTFAPIIGIIRDLSDAPTEKTPVPVGWVHLGLVHSVKVGFDTPLIFNDPALINGRFEHIMEAKRRAKDFEGWSRLVLENL